MKRLGIFLITVIILSGCVKNPAGPLPPVQHKAPTFKDHMNSLKTLGHVYFWIKNFTIYDSGDTIINEFDERGHEFNQNWYHWKEKGFPDQAYAISYEMWKNYEDGENRGQCGQFAATYIVALRDKGYRCGAIIFNVRSGGLHIQAWIEDTNGKIIVTDNNTILSYDYRYNSYTEMISAIDEKLKDNSDITFWFLNDKFEVVFDQDSILPKPLDLVDYFHYINTGEIL